MNQQAFRSKNNTLKCIQPRVFKNPEHQIQLEKKGYIIAQGLSAENIASIEKLILQIKVKDNGYTSPSTIDFSADVSKQINDLLIPIANEICNELMIDYTAVLGLLMTKGVGNNSEMYVHQDWTLVDENIFSSFNIWIPLVDVCKDNGAMFILEGSHKLSFTFRGSYIPNCFPAIDAPFNKLTCLAMKKGELLIYDHRCIHGSPVNKTQNIRPSAVIAIAPINSIKYHYFYKDDNKSIVEMVADSNLLTQITSQSELIDCMNFNNTMRVIQEMPTISEAEILNLIENSPKKQSVLSRILAFLK